MPFAGLAEVLADFFEDFGDFVPFFAGFDDFLPAPFAFFFLLAMMGSCFLDVCVRGVFPPR
jgi:hypothetical protein